MTTTASGSMLMPTAVAGEGGSAHPAAAAVLTARRTCWRGTPATATSPTPIHKAVAGGRPLTAQLLVCASRRRGVLREVMRARDASGRTPLESAHAYASMPPNEVEMEGELVWRWDAAAGGAGADWVTCLHLLERSAAAADIARDGAASTAASSTHMRGVSLHSRRH